ncbi:CBS domain-containing protein [Ferrimonas balearica]|uniref:CBS domain-containing protein n=1 Tax=Ferrimonas balearica TaxID=44012 RepID=UPI001F386C68|nr:CBS domain-containing protein [Ferrimonas balearica]MBY6017046.1 CBS domain-containing protein [Halomonas denitrificans]MBY6093320.1 CBS domain-containing protein [Ferrimonas balearica]
MESVKVIDYMERHPVKLTPDTPLSSAVEMLLSKGQAGAPVVDAESHLLGFISEQDCLAKLLESSYHCDLTAKVEDVMRTDVLSTTPDDSVLSLAEMMLGQKPKIYPVVESGRVIGIIDRSRVLQAIGTHLKVCFRHAV